MNKNYTTKIIDLSNLNVFETAKAIIMTSKYSLNSCKKTKYKISSPNIENILKEIPLNKNIEFITT